jgi:NAD-dependent dihydropyrimidine dehydrogenase PreA subunit
MILYFSATGNCKYVATRILRQKGAPDIKFPCGGLLHWLRPVCKEMPGAGNQDAKPVWVKEKCVMCLGCLHRCPRFAIQYGSRTKNHGQYTNPNVKVSFSACETGNCALYPNRSKNATCGILPFGRKSPTMLAEVY